MEENVTGQAQQLLFLEIGSKSGNPPSVQNTDKKALWKRSDNSFRFNFFTDRLPASPGIISASTQTETAVNRLSFSGQDSTFAFNFEIPTISSAEDMEATESSCSPPSANQQHDEQQQSAPLEESSQSKKKKAKKKKSGSKDAHVQESQQKHEETQEEELSSEEQLNRQLDWCIEQLELGLRSQKGTAKQKEEASRALKTLRSSKAPLVKKRQVMRAMTGKYREKMEEEKKKQFRLIQSEIASAKVKVVSDSPKKSVFHRRAEVKTKPQQTEDNLEKTECQNDAATHSQDDTTTFNFVPSKTEFCFNFF